MKTYKFIEDPGHGWLEVEVSELQRFNLQQQISAFSYAKGDKVYLEEDCDMPIFLRAKRAAGEEYETRRIYQENTPIRGYQSWSVR